MDGMNWQEAFNISALIVGSVGGWVLRTMWNAIEKMREKMSMIDHQTTTTFLTKEEFTHAMDRLESKIDSMFTMRFNRHNDSI